MRILRLRWLSEGLLIMLLQRRCNVSGGLVSVRPRSISRGRADIDFHVSESSQFNRLCSIPKADQKLY